MKRRISLFTLIFLSIDIISKLIIDNFFNLDETKVIINNFFSLTKVYNTGASWNILAGHRLILIMITLIILVLLFLYLNKFKENKRNILAFSLLYGGIIGNLLDRLIYGYVIDFFDFNIFGYDYPVFNIADICIVFGIILLVIAILKKEDENGTSSKK